MTQLVLLILIAIASGVTGVVRFSVENAPAWLDGVFFVLVGSCVFVVADAWNDLTARSLKEMSIFDQ